MSIRDSGSSVWPRIVRVEHRRPWRQVRPILLRPRQQDATLVAAAEVVAIPEVAARAAEAQAVVAVLDPEDLGADVVRCWPVGARRRAAPSASSAGAWI